MTSVRVSILPEYTLNPHVHECTLHRAVRPDPISVAAAGANPCARTASHPRNEAVHHLLLAGVVEVDDEFVAFHVGHIAVAEFLVEHAVAD
jgi:hypothetical protein